MGWTGYHARNYRNGKIDRKAECDSVMNWERDGSGCRVLKSSMVGSTYYAAVESFQTDGNKNTFAVVLLTSIDMKDYCNFYYKDMDETMIPYRYDCPVGILNLLSPTDNENALEWRRLCMETHKAKAGKPDLSKLPIGTVIEFKYNGETYRAWKSAPRYPRKQNFWRNNTYRFSRNVIPDDFKVIGKMIPGSNMFTETKEA